MSFSTVARASIPLNHYLEQEAHIIMSCNVPWLTLLLVVGHLPPDLQAYLFSYWAFNEQCGCKTSDMGRIEFGEAVSVNTTLCDLRLLPSLRPCHTSSHAPDSDPCPASSLRAHRAWFALAL